MESGLLQAGRSVAGRAGGELLVAAAGRRAEERVREAGRPGQDDVLDRAPRAVAALRLAHADVAPDVADRQGRARRVHRQGLGDPHRALEEAARERPAGGSGNKFSFPGQFFFTIFSCDFTRTDVVENLKITIFFPRPKRRGRGPTSRYAATRRSCSADGSSIPRR